MELELARFELRAQISPTVNGEGAGRSKNNRSHESLGELHAGTSGELEAN